MSHLCRKCGKEMPKDRKGWEQICPDCIKTKALKSIKRKGWALRMAKKLLPIIERRNNDVR